LTQSAEEDKKWGFVNIKTLRHLWRFLIRDPANKSLALFERYLVLLLPCVHNWVKKGLKEAV